MKRMDGRGFATAGSPGRGGRRGLAMRASAWGPGTRPCESKGLMPPQTRRGPVPSGSSRLPGRAPRGSGSRGPSAPAPGTTNSFNPRPARHSRRARRSGAIADRAGLPTPSPGTAGIYNVHLLPFSLPWAWLRSKKVRGSAWPNRSFVTPDERSEIRGLAVVASRAWRWWHALRGSRPASLPDPGACPGLDPGACPCESRGLMAAVRHTEGPFLLEVPGSWAARREVPGLGGLPTPSPGTTVG